MTGKEWTARRTPQCNPGRFSQRALIKGAFLQAETVFIHIFPSSLYKLLSKAIARLFENTLLQVLPPTVLRKSKKMLLSHKEICCKVVAKLKRAPSESRLDFVQINDFCLFLIFLPQYLRFCETKVSSQQRRKTSRSFFQSSRWIDSSTCKRTTSNAVHRSILVLIGDKDERWKRGAGKLQSSTVLRYIRHLIRHRQLWVASAPPRRLTG